MIDLLELDNLPEAEKRALRGVTGAHLQEVAANVSARLLDAAGYQVKKRYRSEETQGSLNRLIAYALFSAITRFTKRETAIDRCLNAFDAWTRREPIAGELAQLLAPPSDGRLDLSPIREEQTWPAETGLKEVVPETLLAAFAKEFCRAASRKDSMFDREYLLPLRRMVERIETPSDTPLNAEIARATILAPLDGRERYLHYRERYLHYMAGKTRNLPLRGLDLKAVNAMSQTESGPSLIDVYVALDGWATGEPKRSRAKTADEIRPESEAKPVPALTAFARLKRMVLIGDPGSGKSTFVNHLVYCLAEGQAERLKELPKAWRELLPIRVVLREMAAWTGQNGLDSRLDDLLEGFLRYWLGSVDQSDFVEPMLRALRDGQALLLLDGWDEAPHDQTALPKLREMLNELPNQFPSCPMLVTCRVRSYEEALWRLDADRWPEFRLQDFDDEKIDAFIEAWYRQLAHRGEVRNAQASADKLKAAVRRTDLGRMAGNPLLLTIMAIDHADKGQLPEARSVVYEDVVDLLLWKWRQIEKPDEDAASSLRELLRQAGRQEIDFKRMLWQVAFDVHAGGAEKDGPEQVADIPESTLLQRFADLYPTKDGAWAHDLLRMIQLRAGLLIPSGPDSYTFPHRTFQEYLAACHLCSLRDAETEIYEAARRGVYWREVVLLAINRLVYQSGDTARPFAVVDRLCPTAVLASPNAEEEARWTDVVAAAECLLEIGVERASERGGDLVDRVRHRLVEILTWGLLEIPERVHAGSVLGALGDPRDLGEMIAIPAGEFIMGSDEYDNEKPRRTVILDAYRIRKYPVTNGEYAAFVAATGRVAPQHWQGKVPPPEICNHPVTYVTWDDAAAYCKWAGMSLPTEAQWERAARGTDGREYPWGDEWNASRCNNFLTGPQGTSPVGCYPTGASPDGCLDMAGNVWEWCADWYDPNYYQSASNCNPMGPDTSVYHSRVVRGGSGNGDNTYFFRAAIRGRNGPGSRFLDCGFRCASGQ